MNVNIVFTTVGSVIQKQHIMERIMYTYSKHSWMAAIVAHMTRLSCLIVGHMISLSSLTGHTRSYRHSRMTGLLQLDKLD